MKKCPFCAEEIQDEAIKCRYCGSMLDGAAVRHRFGDALSDGVRLEATRLLNSSGKIQAIKFVRDKKGLSLVQGKAYVEALESGGDPDEAARTARTQPAAAAGCAALVVAWLCAIATMAWWLFV